jgi:hypothetical protein
MQALSARRVPWGSVVIGWTVGGEIGGRIGGDLFGDTGRTYGKWIGAAIGAVFCFFFDCDPGSNGNE